MTPIKQQLDEVNGTAALITNLKPQSLRPSEKLMLYTAEQRVSYGFPMVRCTVRIAAKQTPPQRRSRVSARDEALRRLGC